MGDPAGARLDLELLRDVARRYGALSDELADTTRRQLSGLTFGGESAGRVHGARGEALRASVEGLGVGLLTWARAADEVAAGLAASAERYQHADARGAVRMG